MRVLEVLENILSDKSYSVHTKITIAVMVIDPNRDSRVQVWGRLHAFWKKRNDASEARMKTFEFELVLDGITDITEEDADRLYEAGCDDSTPGVFCGVPVISFHRKAASLDEAVSGAISNVLASRIGPIVVKAVRDLDGKDIETAVIRNILEIIRNKELAGA